jgi:hypothetical protein
VKIGMTKDRCALLTRMFALQLEEFCKLNGLPPGTIAVTPMETAHRVAIEIVIPDEMPLGAV